MREDREHIRSSQLDLFSWREWDADPAETVGHGGRSCDALQPARTAPQDVAAMTQEVLLGALEWQLGDPTGDRRGLVPLIAEVERRREATAAPLLVRVCRRHAGFDRSRAVPEVVAALKALTAVGATRTIERANHELRRFVWAWLYPVIQTHPVNTSAIRAIADFGASFDCLGADSMHGDIILISLVHPMNRTQQ